MAKQAGIFGEESPSVLGAERSARISADTRFRYALGRHWSGPGYTEPPLLVGMLNPSTADGTKDDQTIRKLIGIARLMRSTGVVVFNLYAFRATDPEHLWGRMELWRNSKNFDDKRARDCVGPDNDTEIRRLLASVDRGGPVVCAWGAGPTTRGLRVTHQARVDAVVAMILDICRKPVAFGTTKDGHPRHPLFLKSGATPAQWTAHGLVWKCSDCDARAGAAGPALIHETCSGADGPGQFGWRRP